MRLLEMRLQRVDAFVSDIDALRSDGGRPAGNAAQVAHQLEIVGLETDRVAVRLRSLQRVDRLMDAIVALDEGIAGRGWSGHGSNPTCAFSRASAISAKRDGSLSRSARQERRGSASD